MVRQRRTLQYYNTVPLQRPHILWIYLRRSFTFIGSVSDIVGLSNIFF